MKLFKYWEQTRIPQYSRPEIALEECRRDFWPLEGFHAVRRILRPKGGRFHNGRRVNKARRGVYGPLPIPLGPYVHIA